MIYKVNERRREKRLPFSWPIWFAEDFGKDISCGQIEDISSGGAAFTCEAYKNYPYTGQKVISRFSVPRLGLDGSSSLASFTRTGSVCRVDRTDDFVCKVAVQFAEPLPFRPGEHDMCDDDLKQRLRAVTI